MPEILTESFCERCGTRYTFESDAPRAKPLRGLKTIGRGLRNFVMSDDTSIDEAMAAARSEAERDVATQQLDAFHSTFNFCMSCRQYTCSNCWNEGEGQCLSCSPNLGREPLPAAFQTLDPALQPATEASNGTADLAIEAPTAWPLSDLEAVAEAEVEPIEEIDLSARLRALELDEAETAPETVAEPPPEPSTAPAIAGLGADQTVEEAVAAFEREQAETFDAEAESAAALADEAGPPAEPVADIAPDVAQPAAAEAEPTSVEAARPDEPAATEPEPAQRAAATAEDVVDQPVWLATPPVADESAATAPGLAAAARADPQPAQPESPAQPQWPNPPQWPSQPQWPSRRPATPRPNTILGRPVVPSDGIDALWAASNQEVLGTAPLGSPPRPGGQPAPLAAQPCVSCGLSLSANARFCRRCGSAQTHP